MTTLDIATLAETVNLCFNYSRDIEIFDRKQRKELLFQGEELQEQLNELISKELSKDLDSSVKEANEQLQTISKRLKNKQETLKKFNDTIQQIIDLVAITDTIVKFVTPIPREAAKPNASFDQPTQAVFTIELKDSTGRSIGNLSLFDNSNIQVIPPDVSNRYSSDSKIDEKQGKTKGISIHIGLNRVDPSHYQGWDGRLNGCENDAKSMNAIALQQGFESQLILTQQATVNLISGCQDNQLSMDGNVNGFFTQTLLEVWNDGKFRGSYRQFRREIGNLMPPYQSPHFYMVGTPHPEFENQTPFTID